MKGKIAGWPLLAVAVALVLTLVIVAASRSGAGGSPISIGHASTAQLDNAGLSLLSTTAASTISQAQALASARAFEPTYPPVAAVLAQVTDRYKTPALQCLCWVVDISQPGGIAGSGPATDKPATWGVVLVDAQTGTALEMVAGR